MEMTGYLKLLLEMSKSAVGIYGICRWIQLLSQFHSKIPLLFFESTEEYLHFTNKSVDETLQYQLPWRQKNKLIKLCSFLLVPTIQRQLSYE